MARDYKVLFWTMCDEIRREESQKEFLIGVYNNAILLGAPVPVLIKSLAFRISMQLRRTDFEEAKFRVRDPARKVVLEASGKVRFARTDEPGVISLNFSPVVFHNFGTHTVEFGLDESPRKVGTFEVRQTITGE